MFVWKFEICIAFVLVVFGALSDTPGDVALPCNLATGGLVCWTVGGRGSLAVSDHVEPASALSAASAWASWRRPWRPGGLESRAPGQALQGTAQTGRVVQ